MYIREKAKLKYARKYALKYYKQYLEKLYEEQLELAAYLEQLNKPKQLKK